MGCYEPTRFDRRTQFGMAFDAVAFDLVDACGHTFPLMLQFRPDGQAYKSSGALVSRDREHTVLATVFCSEQWVAALEMTDESARFFATYAPHGDVEAKDVRTQFSDLSPVHDVKAAIKRTRDGRERVVERSDRKDRWVSLWAKVKASSPDSAVLAMMTRASTRRGHAVLEELRTLCCAAGKLRSLRSEEYSMFSAYHPPAVVRSFTVAALSPVLLSVPSDVLGLIADYARLELPYVPMSLPDDESQWSSNAFRHTVDDLEEDSNSDEDEDEYDYGSHSDEDEDEED